MTERRIRQLTFADLASLPDPCAHCTFWEIDHADPRTSSDQRDGTDLRGQWARAVTARWGHCGVLARDGGEIIGFLTLAPADEVPRLGAFATTPVSPDAAVVLSARVVEGYRGVGVGRQLMQAAAALMVRRDIRALEAVGTYRTGSSCVLPVGWLEAVGFTTVRPHPVRPRLRMSLQSTLRWPDLGAAWHRLTDLVQPAREPRGVAWREPADISP